MFYEVLIYLVIYHIDMFSAIVFWKMKPNLFEASETNQQLKNLLKRFKVPKAVIVYTLCVGLEYLIIVTMALFLTTKIIFGDWDIILSLRFTFVFMTFVHAFGLLTNLGAMTKKELVIEKKKVVKEKVVTSSE